MPHESTVDPEEPILFKSWGDETSHLDRRTPFEPTTTPRFNHSISIQTHPDLPTHVTHDHDDDGDPDDANSSNTNQNLELDRQTRVTYTPPKRKKY
jgi:hypothetical protein